MKIGYVLVEKCAFRLGLLSLYSLRLTEGPLEQAKTKKDNDWRDIYSSYRRNYTPNRLKNRFCYFVKKYCGGIIGLWGIQVKMILTRSTIL